MYCGKMLIDGKMKNANDGSTIEVVNPYDQSILGTVPQASPKDVAIVLAAAQKAQKSWASLTAQKRATYLYELAALLDANKDELATLLTAEQGKIRREAIGEVEGSIGFLRYAAESARRIEGNILTSEIPNEQAWIQRVPYGVVVGICAWNFPLALAARKIGGALVTGNTIIIKPPSETPLTVLRFGELVAKSNLPAGVLNIVTGSGRVVGDALVRNRITKLVTLTGSTTAGIEVFKAAAENVVAVRLELGGKAPFIVMNDANLDKAAQCASIARFTNCGQICTCNEKMYVHEDVYDTFVEKLLAQVKTLRVGDPTDPSVDIGPKVNTAEVKKLNDMVAKAREQGAKTLLDNRPDSPPTAFGNWYYPLVVEVPNNENILMTEETFGPVLPILKVHSFEQAIQLANESNYGLSAYLFTNNAKNIMRMVNELEYGEVYVNRENGEMVNAFHNGYKWSGIGGEDGQYGLEGYLQKKTIYMNYDI